MFDPPGCRPFRKHRPAWVQGGRPLSSLQASQTARRYHACMPSPTIKTSHCRTWKHTHRKPRIRIGLSALSAIVLTACSERQQLSHDARQVPAGIKLTYSELEDLLQQRSPEETRLFIENKAAKTQWLAEALAIPEPMHMDNSPVVHIRELLWDPCSSQENTAVRLVALIRGGEMNDDWFQSAEPFPTRHNSAVILVLHSKELSSWSYAGSLRVGGATRAWGGASLPVRVVCGPLGKPWLEVHYGGGAGTGIALAAR